MDGGRKGLFCMGLIFLSACFFFANLFFISFRHEIEEKNDHAVGFQRTRRAANSSELLRNRTTFEEQMEALMTAISATASPQNCVKPAIEDFPDDFMTQYQRQKQGGVVFHFLLAIYMFGALALVCDGYFVPSLEKITDKLHIHSDVAGATFMAAGSSAPELFTSVIGVFITKGDIGLGTVVGSAVFNMLFIVGACGLFAGSTLRLSRWPLLRDSFCYLASIAALIATLYDRKVQWYEALVLICMYLVYVSIMYFNQALERVFEKVTGFYNIAPDIEQSAKQERKSLIKDNDRGQVTEEDQEVRIIKQNDDSPFSVPQGLISRTLWLIELPMTCLFYVTIPDCRKSRWEKWYLVSFFISVFWIAILSYVLVWMVSIIGFTLGISDVIMGLTFMAAGTSVPDGISSLIVARQGDGDMAVSNTIGSNVFDILLCLGLPWLLKTTVVDLGGYVDVLSGSVSYTALSLFGTVFVTLFCIAWKKWRLDKCLGIVFLLLYIAFISVATIFELDVFGNFNLPTCKT